MSGQQPDCERNAVVVNHTFLAAPGAELSRCCRLLKIGLGHFCLDRGRRKCKNVVRMQGLIIEGAILMSIYLSAQTLMGTACAKLLSKWKF
jgi:hypothetical protein